MEMAKLVMIKNKEKKQKIITATVFGYLLFDNRFLRFSLCIKHSGQCNYISKMAKTSKFLKKYSATRRIFNSLLGVCRTSNTVFRV